MESRIALQSLEFRAFQPADVAQAHALASRIGWPQRVEDWEWLSEQSAGYVAIAENRLVGVTLYWLFGDTAASIGAVMVDDAFRGQGIAGQLLAKCLDDLGGRSLLLYATAAGTPLYAKNGFTSFEGLEQYEGVVASDGPEDSPGRDIIPLTPELEDVIVELAEHASGIDRSKVIRSLFNISQGAVLLREGRPAGFAMYRRYGKGWGLGPVVAEGREDGQALVRHCLAMLPGRFVRVDMPSNLGLGGWLEQFGLRRSGSALGMQLGPLPKPSGPLRRFAVITQATG